MQRKEKVSSRLRRINKYGERAAQLLTLRSVKSASSMASYASQQDSAAKGHKGFTILETMIVLAVGTLLFFSAYNIFTNTRANTQFALAARDAETFFQDIINDVATGYYDDLGTGKCVPGGTDTSPPTFVSAAEVEQGTDIGCIFFGKLILVKLNSADVEVFPVVGNQKHAGGLSKSYYEADPTTVYQTTAPAQDFFDQRKLRYGITVKSANCLDAATKVSCGVGTSHLIGLFSDLTNSSGGSVSGAQRINFYYYNFTGTAHDLVKTAINCGGPPPDPASCKNLSITGANQVWELCLTDGKRTATLDIGAANNAVTTNLNLTAVC